ncbi:MAG: hypothetical protein WB784_10655 [Rhodanobacteraceae bacterium]
MVYSDGKPIKVVDTYGCSEPDMLNDGRRVTIVAFADGRIDKAAANAADAPCRALAGQVGTTFHTLVEIKLKYDGTVYNIQTYDANGTSSRSGNGTLKLTRNDGKRVEGSFVTDDASRKSAPGGAFYDLHFAVDVAGAGGR